MSELRIAFFGDIVGGPGRRAFANAVQVTKATHAPDVVIVNGENARNGSGLHPEGYREIRAAGADAITLGDHCFGDMRVKAVFADESAPVARPANLSDSAPGRTFARVGTTTPPIFVVPLMGRLFMKFPVNDPFAALTATVGEITAAHPDAIVITDMHAEATSEKIAMAHHALRTHPRTVLAVVGTHTHVQTNDARIISHTDETSGETATIAAITDLGMCGGHGGVIGRSATAVLDMMTTQRPTHLEVTGDETQARGVLITLNTETRQAIAIEPLVIDDA